MKRTNKMAIKKAYQDIVTLLEQNKDAKVKTILDQVIEMASGKSTRAAGSTAIRDTKNNVVAVFDYYFKRWMPLVGDAAVEFGAKASSPTGLNSMSKEGVSNWTRQQRVAKQENADLLNKVAAGEVAPENIPAEQAKIEERRQMIAETDKGFENKEDVLAYLNKAGVEVATAK